MELFPGRSKKIRHLTGLFLASLSRRKDMFHLFPVITRLLYIAFLQYYFLICPSKSFPNEKDKVWIK